MTPDAVAGQAWIAAAAIATPKPQRKPRLPFGLTERQCEAMSLLVRHGNTRVVADSMGICQETVDVLLRRARRRMKCDNNVTAAIQWDRSVRADIRFTSTRTIDISVALVKRNRQLLDAAEP